MPRVYLKALGLGHQAGLFWGSQYLGQQTVQCGGSAENPAEAQMCFLCSHFSVDWQFLSVNGTRA